MYCLVLDSYSMLAMDRLGMRKVGNSFLSSWLYTCPPSSRIADRTFSFRSLITPLLFLFFLFYTILGHSFEQRFDVWLSLLLGEFRRELGYFRQILLEHV